MSAGYTRLDTVNIDSGGESTDSGSDYELLERRRAQDEAASSTATTATTSTTAITPDPSEPQLVYPGDDTQTILVQGPDGGLAVAITNWGEDKDDGTVTIPTPVVVERNLVHDQPVLPLGGYDPSLDSYEYMMQLRHIRHKKSFVFMLAIDFVFFLIAVYSTASGQTDPKDSLPMSLLVFNLVIDVIGFVGCYYNSLAMINFFIVIEGIAIAIFTFKPNFALLAIRLIIFLLSLQVRAGMVRESELTEYREV